MNNSLIMNNSPVYYKETSHFFPLPFLKGEKKEKKIQSLG